jgi:hypothetical protein
MHTTPTHHTTLAALIPWLLPAPMDPAVIINRDGSLQASVRYTRAKEGTSPRSIQKLTSTITLHGRLSLFLHLSPSGADATLTLCTQACGAPPAREAILGLGQVATDVAGYLRDPTRPAMVLRGPELVEFLYSTTPYRHAIRPDPAARSLCQPFRNLPAPPSGASEFEGSHVRVLAPISPHPAPFDEIGPLGVEQSARYIPITRTTGMISQALTLHASDPTDLATQEAAVIAYCSALNTRVIAISKYTDSPLFGFMPGNSRLYSPRVDASLEEFLISATAHVRAPSIH